MIKLTILHTNDLHGHVHQLSRIATLVRKIRAEVTHQGGECLYLDAGDSEDTSQLESCLTRGAAMNEFMKAAGCEQITLGNAIPIRYGPQAVENIANHFGKPLLCANLFTNKGDLYKGLIPYVVKEINGYKIAIIGLTAPMSVYRVFFGCRAMEPIEVMPDLVQQGRNDGAKTVIALTHIASKEDMDLAEKIDGIDLIIGGHDHKQISPPILINQTYIVQSGQFGEMLGRLDLEIDPETGHITSAAHCLIPVEETIAEDEIVLQEIKNQKALTQKIMNNPVGELLFPLDCSDVEQCSTGNILADALLEHSNGAQIAMVINGHWQNGLKEGVVTQGDLYSANRSAGNPGRIELTGAQLRQFFISALKPENMQRKIRPLRGRSVGMPHIAGMQIEIDKNDPENLLLYYNGNLIESQDKFKVIASDMEYSDILGYLPISDELIEYETPIVLPEILEEYIRKHSPVGKIQNNRILFK